MKKFLVFITVVLLLCAGGFWGYMNLIRPKNYAVFVSSMKHGTVSVEGYEKTGDEHDFRVVVPNGGKLTLHIAPEITDTSYYVLSKLLVNGEDCSDSVQMLEYTTEVKSKLSIIAYFKAADRPASVETGSKLVMPAVSVKTPNVRNAYLGSEGAYDMSCPSVIFDNDSGYYYCFASGNRVSRSEDLVNWESMGTYFKTPAGCEDSSVMDFGKFRSVKSWSLEHGYDTDYGISSDGYNRVPSSPDIIRLDGEYFLYFTLRKGENSRESAIFCVKTNDLASAVSTNNWEDVGLVLCTCETDRSATAVACHPSVFASADGDVYMAYGGYAGNDNKDGGIFLAELDPDGGLLLQSSSVNAEGETVGTENGEEVFHSGPCIAKPGKVKNGSNVVSGVDIAYVEDADCYFMFVTYGIEGTGEEIRVFRSSDAKGPYTDFNGKKAVDTKKSDQYSLGLKLAGAYAFTSSKNDAVAGNELGRVSLGSACLVKTKDGYVLFAHSGLSENREKPSLDIRKVLWDDKAWPLVSPEPYRTEVLQKVDISEMYGIWDVVVFDRNSGSELYEGQPVESFKTSIYHGMAITDKNIRDGERIKDLSFLADGDYGFRVKINGKEYKVYAVAAYDSELACDCVAFTGMDADGETVWGKKSISPSGGLYTDVFDYILSMADGELKEKYEKKYKKISSAPSQARIDTLTANLISELNGG